MCLPDVLNQCWNFSQQHFVTSFWLAPVFIFAERMVVVSVSEFDLATVCFRMTVHDTVGDVNTLLQEATGINHQIITLKHHGRLCITASENDMTVGKMAFSRPFEDEHHARFMMSSPSVDNLKVAQDLKALQETASQSEEGFIVKGDLTITRSFITLTSHGLVGKKDESQVALPKHTPASSSASANDNNLQVMKQEIVRLQEQNANFADNLRTNQKRITELKKLCRDGTIVIQLRKPSGALSNIITKASKTVGQW